MLALLTAVVAAATAQPAARPVDPAAMAAATVLVQQLGLRGQIERGMARNVEMMRSGVAMRAMLAPQPGFIQAYKANQAKFDAALKKAGGIQAGIAEKAVRDNINAVVAEATKAYARNFTAAELKGLAEFYRTPLGQAMLERQGRVSNEIAQASERIIGGKIEAGMQAAAPQIQAALAPLNAGPPPKAK